MLPLVNIIIKNINSRKSWCFFFLFACKHHSWFIKTNSYSLQYQGREREKIRQKNINGLTFLLVIHVWYIGSVIDSGGETGCHETGMAALGYREWKNWHNGLYFSQIQAKMSLKRILAEVNVQLEFVWNFGWPILKLG